MAQLSLYLNDETMRTLNEDASREGKSLSKFVAGVLRDRKESGAWPQGFFDLYGALGDDTFTVPSDEPFAAKPIPAWDLS